jgi:hypothetical protein
VARDSATRELGGHDLVEARSEWLEVMSALFAD